MSINFDSITLYFYKMNCLSTPYLIETVESSKFGNANGILNMFRGVGCFFGPYIAGKKILYSFSYLQFQMIQLFIFNLLGQLSEKTNSIFPSFLFAGVSYGIAFVLSLIVTIYTFVKNRRSKDSDQQIANRPLYNKKKNSNLDQENYYFLTIIFIIFC